MSPHGKTPALPRIATDAILESISDGVFTVDRGWRITSFNRAAEQITGVPREDALGRRCSDVFRASMCESECALRQRREDIPLLVQHHIEVFNAIQNKRVTGVSPDVLGVLAAHDYPGNVRELQNIIEHAFVLVREGPIRLEHLPVDLVPISLGRTSGGRMNTTVKAAEAQAIREAIERNGGNRLSTARELGMHRSTLFRKARLLGIALPEQDGRFHRKTGRRRHCRRRVSLDV